MARKGFWEDRVRGISGLEGPLDAFPGEWVGLSRSSRKDRSSHWLEEESSGKVKSGE